MSAWWVQADVLARSGRPGYPSRQLKRAEIDHWLYELSYFRIKSVICLLSKELQLYEELLREEGGLLGLYRAQGWVVHSISVEDYKNPALDDQELAAVVRAFRKGPKPVLVHCSAGMDRTGMAVAHLQQLGLVK